MKYYHCVYEIIIFILFQKKNMFSKLARQVMKKNFSNFKRLYNQNRNLTWEVPNNSYNKIGIEKDTISVYEGVRSIKYNKNKNIKKGEVLFEVETDTFINNKFIANDHCVVIEKNREVMKTLNTNKSTRLNRYLIRLKL